jgi:hypothetical protein
VAGREDSMSYLQASRAFHSRLVTPSETCVFSAYPYRFEGRERQSGLGSEWLVRLAEARRKALEFERVLRVERIDPIEHVSAKWSRFAVIMCGTPKTRADSTQEDAALADGKLLGEE